MKTELSSDWLYTIFIVHKTWIKTILIFFFFFFFEQEKTSLPNWRKSFLQQGRASIQICQMCCQQSICCCKSWHQGWNTERLKEKCLHRGRQFLRKLGPKVMQHRTAGWRKSYSSCKALILSWPLFYTRWCWHSFSACHLFFCKAGSACCQGRATDSEVGDAQTLPHLKVTGTLP